MDEKKLLASLARALKAEDVLTNIELKETREEKLLGHLNKTVNNLVSRNKDHAAVIQKEIADVIPTLIKEDAPGTAGRQPEPELPKKDIIDRSVELLSKASQKEIQNVADQLPDGIRKELDIIKKSIADFHRFASRHSQLGGGGEVKLARLDDVNASTIAEGLYLRYDLTTNMFIFDNPLGAGGAGAQADWNQSNTSAPDYIKHKPLLAMDANNNISVSATIVSNNSYTLGTLAQPWAGLYLSANSLTILPDTGNVNILVENNNGVMRLLTGGFAVNDLTQVYELFKVDTSAGLTSIKSRGTPAIGQAVLNISANPSSNIIPLVSTVVGGVIHATGSNTGPTLITIDSVNDSNVATQTAAAVVMRKFRGTVDNPSPVSNNDVLGTVTAVGYGAPTGPYNVNGLPVTAQNWIRWRSIEDHTLTAQGAQLEFNLIPTGSIVAQTTLLMTASGNTPGLQFSQPNSGIKFTDGSFQNTAAVAQVQSDWNEANTSNVDYIKNKPDLSVYSLKAGYMSSYYNGANVAYANTANAYVVPVGTAVMSRNITIDGNNSFVIGATSSGKYIINYSIQYQNSRPDNDFSDVYVWIRKNGIDIPDTTSVFTIAIRKSNGDPGKLIALSPVFFSANTGDTIQVMAAAPYSAYVTMITIPAITANTIVPNVPETPATIMVLQEVT